MRQQLLLCELKKLVLESGRILCHSALSISCRRLRRLSSVDMNILLIKKSGPCVRGNSWISVEFEYSLFCLWCHMRSFSSGDTVTCTSYLCILYRSFQTHTSQGVITRSEYHAYITVISPTFANVANSQYYVLQPLLRTLIHVSLCKAVCILREILFSYIHQSSNGDTSSKLWASLMKPLIAYNCSFQKADLSRNLWK